MAEAAQERVQTSMTSMVDDIDKSYLRKMQVCIHPVLRTVAMVAVVLCGGANAMPVCTAAVRLTEVCCRQGDMHRCAARCCDDPSSSIDKVHGCIEQCSIPLQKAQHFVQTQMSDIQVSRSSWKWDAAYPSVGHSEVCKFGDPGVIYVCWHVLILKSA